MLQNIRDQITGWVAAVIFTLLTIPFALWGVNTYFEGGGGVTAIDVNGEDISLAEYQQARQEARQRWRESTAEPATAEIEALLQERAIEQLIQAEIFRQQSDKMGLSVSDKAVAQTLEQIPAFNDENGFNAGLLRAYAAGVGLTLPAFMAQFRESMLVELMQAAFYESSFSTEAEALLLTRIENEKRDFDYGILSADKFRGGVDLSEEEIEAHYQENEDLFTEPEKVKLRYLVLSAAKIAEDITLREEEIKTWFEENRQNYEVEAQRHIRQVLVKAPTGAAETALAAMREQAAALHTLIEGGVSLEQAVTENTEAGADDNIEFSEFEFLSKGVLEPDIDAALLEMKAGQISEPLQSKEGFHIIELVAIKGGVSVTLEEARKEIVADIKLARAAERLYDQSERLATLAYEHPDTLAPAAEELELQIQESDYISRGEPGAGVIAEPAAVSAAFSPEVLEGENSDLLELADDRLMVLRVADHIAAEAQPLDSVREQIVTRLKFEKTRDLTREKGEGVVAALQRGETRKQAAAEVNINWQSAKGVLRDDADINRAVLRQAFNAGRPLGDDPLISGVSFGGGDYAVVIVRRVHGVAEEDIKKADIKAMREQLSGVRAATDWQEFNRELRRRADVGIYEEAR